MEPRNAFVPGTEAVGIGVLVSVLLATATVLVSIGAADPLPPTGNVRIDSGVGASVSPALSAEPWGRVHSAWQDNRTGLAGIYYARSTDFGASWGPDRRLDAPPPGAQSYEADITVDLTGSPYNGSVYVVWQTMSPGAGDVWIVRSPDGGITWNPALVLDQGPAAARTYHPSVAVGTDGNVFVVWADNRDGSNPRVFLRASTDGGTTWSAEVPMSASGMSSLRPIVVASTDAVYAAWIRTDLSTMSAISVAASGDGGATWRTDDAVVRTLPETIRDFDGAVGPEGDVHLAFVASDASAQLSVEYSHSDDLGLTFAPPAIVATWPTGSIVTDARIAVLGPVIAVAWAGQAGGVASGDFDVLYAWRGGGAWSTPIRVDDTDRNPNPADDSSDQHQPAIAAGGATAYVAWSDARSGTSADIYASSAEWTQPLITEIRDSPDGQEFVELCVWGRAAISMSGWSLEVDGAMFDLAGLGMVPGGAHVTVGDSSAATLTLPIDLNDEGSLVRLLDPSAAVVDAAGYGQRGVATDPRGWESTARYTNGLAYGRSWTWESVPTPAAPNAVPPSMLGPPVVLNEVLFNPSAPSRGFVELYYLGGTPTRVFGLGLLGDAMAALPPIDFSPAQPYYVVYQSAAPTLFSSLDAGGDNVYLTDASGRFWDEAGWSSPHGPDMTMARTVAGEGTHDGYDDASSIAAGWTFDLAPSLTGIRIGPDQNGIGDLGQAVRYDLTVTNELRSTEDVEIEATSGPTGWRVDLLASNGVTPLADTNGNGVPDLPALAGLGSRGLVAIVYVPSTQPIGDTEVTRVTAYAFSNDAIRATAVLTTATVPHINPLKWATPTTIYVEGSPPPLVTQSTVHLEIVGSGQAFEQHFPQDTIFVIDSSGSMTIAPWNSDPTGLRIDAIKQYIDGMSPEDRSAIVGFAYDPDYLQDFGAWLVNDVNGGTPGHLTAMDAAGMALMKANAETMRFGNGGTNIEKALQVAHQELLPSYAPTPACRDYARPFPAPPAAGMPGHTWVEILLTDGLPSHALACTDDEVVVAAASGIRIFTIGLGSFADEAYLRNIATRTGGKYYKADTADDLAAIYTEISTFVSRIAGYDSDVNDDIPMVTDVVPGNVHIVPGTFRDPATGNPRPPDWQQVSGGQTILEWNVSQLQIGESWAVEYRVSTAQVGLVPVSVYPDARVTYLRWDDRSVTLPFPPVAVTVLAPPPPPVTYTITRNPSRGYVIVDRVPYLAPHEFPWTPGDTHEISVPREDVFAPTERDLFDWWDDGGAVTHIVTVGPADVVITAVFVPQVRPTVTLAGTDAVHTVAAYYPYHLQDVMVAGVSGTWSDWVDAGGALAFDPLAAGSDSRERWMTVEDFSVPPWDAVTIGFTETVVYHHQAVATIRTSGLGPFGSASVAGRAFDAPLAGATSDTWSAWVDVGSPLSIENPVQVSTVQRYASRDPSAWTVEGPLEVDVLYFLQWRVRVITIGLEASRPTPLRAVQFGAPLGASPWSEWEDWVDDQGQVSVDRLLMAGPRERFRTEDVTAWSIRSPATLTVRYVHEYLPSVTLVGTDADHTVSLTIHHGDRTVALAGLHGEWTDWVEAGARLQFSGNTSGTPARWAMDPTTLDATRAFAETIRYAPREPNLKPLISVLYVVAMLGAAGAVAYRRPLDIFLLPSEVRRRTRGRREQPAAFRLLDVEDPVLKLRRDRRVTFAAIGPALAAAEGMIGIASLVTGFLRVPEEGNWLSLGFVVNAILLGSALALDGVAYGRGYRPRPPATVSRRSSRPASQGPAPEAGSEAVPPPPPPDDGPPGG